MSFPTAAQLEKAVLNLAAHDAVVNGDENTTEQMPDGEFVDTVAKAIATIKAFNDRGDWAQDTLYAVKDLVRDPDDSDPIVYVRVESGTSPASGDFQDEYNNGDGPWRIYQDTRGLAFDVQKFGAIGDGSTNNRSALQDAIDAAFAAGGGDVVFPC